MARTRERIAGATRGVVIGPPRLAGDVATGPATAQAGSCMLEMQVSATGGTCPGSSPSSATISTPR
jgi:hypothetical protein